MSQTPITVQYPLEDVLGELKQSIKEVNQNLANIQKDVNDLKVGQIELKTEVRNFKEDVKEIKTVQNSLINEVSNLKGVKSLIIPIVVAVSTALLTLLVRLIPNVPR